MKLLKKLLKKNEKQTLKDALEIIRFIYYNDEGDKLSKTIFHNSHTIGKMLTLLTELVNYIEGD